MGFTPTTFISRLNNNDLSKFKPVNYFALLDHDSLFYTCVIKY